MCTWSKTRGETTVQSNDQEVQRLHSTQDKKKTLAGARSHRLLANSKIKYLTETQKLTLNQEKSGLGTSITDPETRMGHWY